MNKRLQFRKALWLQAREALWSSWRSQANRYFSCVRNMNYNGNIMVIMVMRTRLQAKGYLTSNSYHFLNSQARSRCISLPLILSASSSWNHSKNENVGVKSCGQYKEWFLGGRIREQSYIRTFRNNQQLENNSSQSSEYLWFVALVNFLVRARTRIARSWSAHVNGEEIG